jgi:heptosyltransferase I
LAERFLISRLSSLGDVVCSLPAAGALKRAFPESSVVWAVDPRFAGIVRSCRFVDEVVEVKPSFKKETWPVFEGEFDAALDLQGLLKSALVLKGAKSKTKVGYHWQREGAWLFSERVIPDPSSFHVVDQYVDVARAVGGDADIAEFGLQPTPEAVESIRPKIPQDAPFVVLNGGAGWVTKRWPPERFSSLIDSLDAIGYRSALIGGRTDDDQQVGKAIEEAAKSKPVNLIGQTSILELVALLSLAKGHVGGDTGSSHLAAGLGIPAIGLYSITKPVRSCPYGQIDRCHYDARGLAHIEPDQVLSSLREAMQA